MKRQFIYSFVLFATLCHPALAQSQKQAQPSRWSITLSGGAALPTSSFAHFSNGVATGTVLPGAGMELSSAYRLDKIWSAVLAGSGQQNRGDGIPYLESGTQGSTNYNNRYWHLARFQAGAALTIPVTRNNRLALQLRALAGVQKTWPSEAVVYFPTVDYPTTEGINPGGINLPGPLRSGGPGIYPSVKLPWAFSWETDAGLQWTLNKQIALLATGGYSDSRPSRTFTYILGTNTTTGMVEGYNRRGSFPTPTVHARAGISYHL